MVVGEKKSKGKLVDATCRKPFFPEKEKGGQKTLLQKKEPERDSIQQVNADPNCNQTIEGIFPRTQNCLDKWTELTDDQDIIDIVSGYQLDFSEISHQQKLPTPFTISKEEERSVDLEVEELLRKGAIEEVEPCKNQFLSNVFTIPKKGGEKAGGKHEGSEQFDRTSSFQNGGSFAPAIRPPEGRFYVQDRHIYLF